MHWQSKIVRQALAIRNIIGVEVSLIEIVTKDNKNTNDQAANDDLIIIDSSNVGFFINCRCCSRGVICLANVPMVTTSRADTGPINVHPYPTIKSKIIEFKNDNRK